MSESSICPWCLEVVCSDTCEKCGASTRRAEEIERDREHTFSTEVIGGRYRVTRFLGEGAMGEVYEAYDHTTDEMVAIKFMLESKKVSDELQKKYRKRFLKECRTLAKLKSPFIVSFIDSEEAEDGTPALVMELLRGQSLADLLRRERRLSLEQIVDITVPICRALQQAHQKGYVHRDLKPSNIFLHDSGDGNRVVKVVDFGIVKVPDDEKTRTSATVRGEVLGSIPYMSPEHLGLGEVTGRSDLFSLGTILYQMVSGRLPFHRNIDVAVMNAIVHEERLPFEDGLDVPPALVELIDSLLQKDPARRPPDASTVEKRLLLACGTAEAETVRLSPEDIEWLIGNRATTQRRADVGFEVPDPGRSVLSPSVVPDSRQINQNVDAIGSGRNEFVREQREGPSQSDRLSTSTIETPSSRRTWMMIALLAVILTSIILAWVVWKMVLTTSVSAIRNDCASYAFRELSVSGTVRSSMSIPLTDLSAYKLSDGRSAIWVLSDSPAPSDNSDLRLKAVVIEKDMWSSVCSGDDPPEDCLIISGAMKIAGGCVLLEMER